MLRWHLRVSRAANFPGLALPASNADRVFALTAPTEWRIAASLTLQEDLT